MPAGGFDVVGDVILNEFSGGGSGALGIAREVGVFEGDFFEEVVGVLEFFFGFAAEADDDIGADGDVGDFGAQFSDDVAVLFGGVSAVHAAQCSIVAGLDGQVEIWHLGLECGHGFDQFVGHVFGMGRSEADAEEALVF